MRKVATLFIAVALLGALSTIFIKASSLIEKHVPEKKTEKHSVETLPAFQFKKLDGNEYSKNELDFNKATVIIRFDTGCSLCEKSGRFFSKFAKLHKKSNVLFVSSNTVLEIEAYRKQFNLDILTNIVFLIAKEEDFFEQFNELTTPTYFIYNSKGSLVKMISGEVPTKVLLSYIIASQSDEKV